MLLLLARYARCAAINNHQNDSKTPEQKQKWTLQEKRSEDKNPGFEGENQMQSSGTVENLTTGGQSEICALTVLCNAYQIISHTASTHPHQC